LLHAGEDGNALLSPRGGGGDRIPVTSVTLGPFSLLLPVRVRITQRQPSLIPLLGSMCVPLCVTVDPVSLLGVSLCGTAT